MTDALTATHTASFALEDAWTLPTYAKPPVALVRGENATVWDADGAAYLDLYGGHCVALLGHCPPRVVEAVRRQAGELLFYSNAVYSPIRAEAARALTALAPEPLRRVFFCNSGSEANETALKLARAYTGRSEIVAMAGGFHGRTLGSLAVTDGDHYHAPYRSALPTTRRVPFGDTEAAASALAPGDVAAILLEPIQSMAGIVEAAPEYYHALRRICDATGTLLIFDEVQTGVGRTGRFSYSEHVDVVPDLITLAKSLGSGVPVGATLVHERVAATVKPGDQGTTFGGGMLAMAAVLATVETLVDDALMPRAETLFEAFAATLGAVDGVAEVRGRGGLIGVVLDRPAAPVRVALREVSILVGGSNDAHTLRLLPPLTTPLDAADTLAAALDAILAKS